MELTTLEIILLAPLTNTIIDSPTAPDKLKAIYADLRERMVDALTEVDEGEIIAALEDIEKMDSRYPNRLRSNIEMVKILRSIKKSFGL